MVPHYPAVSQLVVLPTVITNVVPRYQVGPPALNPMTNILHVLAIFNPATLPMLTPLQHQRKSTTLLELPTALLEGAQGKVPTREEGMYNVCVGTT